MEDSSDFYHKYPKEIVNMKDNCFTPILRVLTILIMVMVSSKVYPADIALTCSVNNYWNSWEQASGVGVYGNYSGFSISYYGASNWDWFFKFHIDNYREPSKDEIKRHLKDKSWYVYSGTVEYYVTDKYPTIEAVMRATGAHLLPPNGSDHRVKRTARATIKIEPYKKKPKVYNIYFDGVGYAIDLKSCKWD